MSEKDNEEHLMESLDGALPSEQRIDDVAADVGQHAPEQGMRQAVEAPQSEQRIGPQQLDTDGTLLDERGGQPARPREGRQQKGVDPGDDAEGEDGQRALARTALQEAARENAGGEVRRCGERPTAHVDQYLTLATGR